MKTKTLSTIQHISKICKIVTKVLFIFCIVGAIGSAVGIVALALIPDGIKLGGVTIHGMIEESGDVSLGTCYTAMATGMVLCIGFAVLLRFAALYFSHELEAGTPFTFDGAKELMRLGICSIVIPLVTYGVATTVYLIMKHFFDDVSGFNISDKTSVGVGILIIFISLLCRHGAEIINNKEEIKDAE